MSDKLSGQENLNISASIQVKGLKLGKGEHDAERKALMELAFATGIASPGPESGFDESYDEVGNLVLVPHVHIWVEGHCMTCEVVQ